MTQPPFLSRRLLLAGAIVLALGAGVQALRVPAVQAAAPLAKVQAPGFYRLKVGAFEVTALSDGTVALPVDKLLTNARPEVIQGLLGRAYLKSPVETSVNAFLVNTGDKLVLVDTGAGSLFGPTLGRLVGSLKAAGYQPEQVDLICITHMHGDHIGGLVADGRRAFPNAVVRADRREGEYWLSKANLDKAPDDRKDAFRGAQAMLGPYVEAGRYQPFDGATELLPGVRAVPAYGHTPGHSFYEIESEGSRMMFWGDVMHVAAVQFPRPSVTMSFDSDSSVAEPVREKAFADAAAQGYRVAFAHVSFPGIGQLRANGGGYDWLPVNYVSAP